MKLRKYITFAFIAAMLTACSEDFLTKAPEDTINTANFFQTEADAIGAVNGAYQPLQWPKLYNMRMWTTDIMAGNSIVGAGGGTDGIETQDEANFVTATDNQGVLDLWRGPWPGILRCNIILKNVPGMTIKESVKNRVLGEAYFLRANYYFILVRFFGDVPLVTEPTDPSSDLRPLRAAKADVYNLIISDLNNAINLLPQREEYSGSDVGRASKGAATGTLAKVYLTMGDNWQKVVDLCNQVKDLGYALNTSYADNFDCTKENGVESLFEIQYVGNAGYSFWANENQASWLSTFTGPRGSNMVNGGWGWNQPTQEFVNAYEAGDKRKDATVFYQGCPKFDGMDYDKAYSTTGYNLRKFVVNKTLATSYDNSPLNFPVLRYADILLMKAEALNELGNTTEAQLPAANANATLNKVRARAGLTDVTGLSQSALRDKILHERRMELAFEGQRWFDLVRINSGQYGIDFLKSIGKSNMNSKYLLFPIPQKERDSNPNLTQNTGY
ncbi:MAG: RagB/SusD family nutrient uptake outer membrane protein [Paludibacter sp.]|nr:RagB/SusD family nutrient uptake outer membrane protein [Paludibacter sp.]